jgi:hypothetical protein
VPNSVVCQTVTLLQCTGMPAPLSGGRIYSWTRYLQRTSSWSGNSRMRSTTVSPPVPSEPGSQAQRTTLANWPPP